MNTEDSYINKRAANLKANIELTKRIAANLNLKDIPEEVLERIRKETREYMSILPRSERMNDGCQCAKCADRY